MERITDAADLAAGAAQLVTLEPRFGPVIAELGALPLRLRPDGFATLLNAIVSQQVSTASAAAIWARVEAAGLTTEAAVALASEDDLRAVGLSRPKMRYAWALAAARIDYAALWTQTTPEVVTTLTEVSGIGVWTAEIYAKFALGHADAFAAGDLALQEAAKGLFELPKRPSEKALRSMAEAWSPVRSVAARALWAYYRLNKGREGIG